MAIVVTPRCRNTFAPESAHALNAETEIQLLLVLEVLLLLVVENAEYARERVSSALSGS